MRRLIPFLCWLWLCGGLSLLAACQEPKDATTPVSVINEARQAWLDNDFSTAESCYQQYLQHYPEGSDRVEAWKRLADIAYAVRGQAGPAVALLETALLEKKLTAIGFLELSSMAMETAMRARQYDKAIFFAQNVLERTDLPPVVLPPVYLQLHKNYLSLDDLPDARETLRQCRTRLADDVLAAPCTYHLGLLLLKDDKPDGTTLLLSVYTNPAVPPSLRAEAGFALGEAAEAEHENAKARYWYQAVKESFPNPKVILKKLELLKK